MNNISLISVLLKVHKRFNKHKNVNIDMSLYPGDLSVLRN
jgi:hypothetical protein